MAGAWIEEEGGCGGQWVPPRSTHWSRHRIASPPLFLSLPNRRASLTTHQRSESESGPLMKSRFATSPLSQLDKKRHKSAPSFSTHPDCSAEPRSLPLYQPLRDENQTQVMCVCVCAGVQDCVLVAYLLIHGPFNFHGPPWSQQEQLEAFGRCSNAIWTDQYFKHRCGSTSYHRQF